MGRPRDRLMWIGQWTVMCSVGMMERYFCYGQASINTTNGCLGEYPRPSMGNTM